MSVLLVGVDLGTTSVKAVALSPEGRQRGLGRVPYSWSRTTDGIETDPLALYDAARRAIRMAVGPGGEGSVAAVGVASMGEAGVLLDRSGEPVAPLIAWHDRRDGVEEAALAAELGATAFARRTGLPLRRQWSLTKHRWLMQHHPPARKAVRRLSVAEWVVRALGGEEGSEQSLASRTGWLELASRAWWPEALDWSHAQPSLLPPLVTAGEPLGRATGSALPELEGAVLTVAGHDHQAAAVGLAAASAGVELDSCGTAHALIRTVSPGLADDAVTALVRAGVTVGWHAMPDRWCLLGGTRGGAALERVLRLLGCTSADLPRLDEAAAATTAGPAALELSAIDADRMELRGIDDDVSPGHVWRAAVEAVAAESGRIHDAMSAVVGAPEQVVVTGGWARSSALLAAKRRSFAAPLSSRTVSEAGARGAALLAGVAAGVYPGAGQLPQLDLGLQDERPPSPGSGDTASGS